MAYRECNKTEKNSYETNNNASSKNKLKISKLKLATSQKVNRNRKLIIFCKK